MNPLHHLSTFHNIGKVVIYDVLTHDGPYATRMNKDEALEEISAGAGSQFDPDLTKKFLEYMTARAM